MCPHQQQTSSATYITILKKVDIYEIYTYTSMYMYTPIYHA